MYETRIISYIIYGLLLLLFFSFFFVTKNKFSCQHEIYDIWTNFSPLFIWVRWIPDHINWHYIRIETNIWMLWHLSMSSIFRSYAFLYLEFLMVLGVFMWFGIVIGCKAWALKTWKLNTKLLVSFLLPYSINLKYPYGYNVIWSWFFFYEHLQYNKCPLSTIIWLIRDPL